MDAKIQLQSSQVSRHDGLVLDSKTEGVSVLGIFQAKENKSSITIPLVTCDDLGTHLQISTMRPA